MPSAISVALTSEYEWSLWGSPGRHWAWGFSFVFCFCKSEYHSGRQWKWYAPTGARRKLGSGSFVLREPAGKIFFFCFLRFFLFPLLLDMGFTVLGGRTPAEGEKLNGPHWDGNGFFCFSFPPLVGSFWIDSDEPVWGIATR